MSKFRIFQDINGSIRINECGLIFETRLYQPEGYRREYYFNNVEEAERMVERVVDDRKRRSSAKSAARSKRGLIYEIDAANDDRYTIKMAFRIYHDGKLSESYYLNEKTWAGWVKVRHKVGDKKPLRRFDSLNEAQQFISNILDEQEAIARRVRSAKTLKVIDSRMFDKGRSTETA